MKLAKLSEKLLRFLDLEEDLDRLLKQDFAMVCTSLRNFSSYPILLGCGGQQGSEGHCHWTTLDI